MASTPVRVGTPPSLPAWAPLLPAHSLLVWVSESEGGKRCEETQVQEGDRWHEAPGYVILMSTEKRECGKGLVDCFEIAVTFT